MTREEYLRRKKLKAAAKSLPPMKPIPSTEPLGMSRVPVLDPDTGVVIGSLLIANAQRRTRRAGRKVRG